MDDDSAQPSEDAGLIASVKRLLCSTATIVVVAFVFRMAILYHFSLDNYARVVVDKLPYGYETGAVAASIAEGRGFSSPLRMVETGATAWFAPIYPYLLAAIFKIFGVYSYSSNLVIHTFNVACAAFICWPIAAIARTASRPRPRPPPRARTAGHRARRRQSPARDRPNLAGAAGRSDRGRRGTAGRRCR